MLLCLWFNKLINNFSNLRYVYVESSCTKKSLFESPKPNAMFIVESVVLSHACFLIEFKYL